MNRDMLVGLSTLACGRLGDHAALIARVRAAAHGVSAQARPWYRIAAAAKASEADVYIYDEISLWGITADDFAREVAGLDVGTINLHLNSPGGYVFDGIAIHNTLISHKATVNVTVDGVAASIGAVIAMAGDTVTMGRGRSMMIHNPQGGVIGESADMREMADLLDQLGGDIAGFYQARAGGSVEQWLATMAETKWYTAQAAVEAGLADAVLGADPPPPQNRERAPDPAALARTRQSDAVKARVRDTLRGVESK